MKRKIKILRDGSVTIDHETPQHFDAGGTALAGPATSSTNASNTNPNTGVLGTINGAIGLNNNFAAQSANLTPGTNVNQLNSAYTGAQSGLTQQQQLVNALQGQNGLGNQSSVFNQQQQLANALQTQAAGGGPNPAQAALNQNTGNNVAATAALMAGQRGSSANPGQVGINAAQVGANTEQQAVGQGATLQAQQQLAAEQNLSNQQAQMQGVAANQIAAQSQNTNNLSQAQQSEQNILQNANTSLNNANVGMQENLNNTNASTSAANQNMAGNIFGGITSGLSSAASSVSSMFAKGGQVKSKTMEPHVKSMAMLFHPNKFAEGGEIGDSEPDQPASTSDYGSFDPVSSSPSAGPGGGAAVSLPADQTDFSKSMGGSSSGGGAGIASLAALMAKGGKVKKMASGGQMDFGSWASPSSSASAGPGGGGAVSLPTFQDAKWGQSNKSSSPQGQPQSTGAGDFVTPDEATAEGTGTQQSDTEFNPDISYAAKGGWMGMTGGGKVAGKPKVNKDSYSNDTVKAKLSPGEIVLPLHVVNSDDPVSAAANFVAAIVKKNGKNKPQSDFHEALKTAIKARKK